MAKKKFNISSTLKKNKKEEIKLAPKVPLKKTPKNIDEIKEKVEQIHYGEPKSPEGLMVKEPPVNQSSPEPIQAPDPEPESAKPSTPKPEKSPKSIKPEKPKIVRMTIDTPEDIHLRLKIKSIQARTSMKDYVLALIEKDLKKG